MSFFEKWNRARAWMFLFSLTMLSMLITSFLTGWPIPDGANAIFTTVIGSYAITRAAKNFRKVK